MKTRNRSSPKAPEPAPRAWAATTFPENHYKNHDIAVSMKVGKLKKARKLLEWRNWQTHGTQNPALFTEHEGSTPSSSTSLASVSRRRRRRQSHQRATTFSTRASPSECADLPVQTALCGIDHTAMCPSYTEVTSAAQILNICLGAAGI